MFRAVSIATALTLCASAAVADMVVINGRYVVAKEDVRGYFYRERDQTTVFDVRWSDWSTRYRCSDAYDRFGVEAAALNLVLKLQDARALDFGEFLTSEGFAECEKF